MHEETGETQARQPEAHKYCQSEELFRQIVCYPVTYDCKLLFMQGRFSKALSRCFQCSQHDMFVCGKRVKVFEFNSLSSDFRSKAMVDWPLKIKRSFAIHSLPVKSYT